jgi:hypothetical protein
MQMHLLSNWYFTLSKAIQFYSSVEEYCQSVNGLTTIDIHPGMVVHLIWDLQGEVLQLVDL